VNGGRRSLACGVLCALLAGAGSCDSPPTREELLQEDGAPAPVSAAPPLDERTIRRAAPTEKQRDFVRRVHALESALTGRPLLPGNQVTLLRDGPATHAAQLAAIGRARHHVHLLAYIITDDAIGQEYRDALASRARAGVEVRVMFDSVGGLDAGSAFLEALEDAGVELHEYASINPLQQPELWRISQRNHRKILVVDGRVAFTGGIGISDTYREAPTVGGSGGSESGWRDTHIRITGPAVAEFQRLFIEDWQREVGPIPDEAEFWPELAPTGDELVRAVAKDGKDMSDLLLSPFTRLWRNLRSRRERLDENAIYASYLAAIAESRHRIWITQAYFAPNPEFLEVLENAARLGRDVRLLVPGNSDVGLLLHASRDQYAELLEAGVRIFEYEGPVLHAKTAVVDGVWSTVGSSNLDYRSFVHNDEANATVVGHAFAREMERMFLVDLASAREVTLDTWSQRPLGDRVLQTLAGSLKYWI
jgi:cardiolipin synthase A/B